jgi:hypothetical protein
MGKRRKDDEIGRLEQEVRDLKAVNRSLLKRLKKLNRGFRKERGEEETPKRNSTKKPRKVEPDDDKPYIPPSRKCPDCEKGEVVEFCVLDRRWEQCTICDRRTKTKII